MRDVFVDRAAEHRDLETLKTTAVAHHPPSLDTGDGVQIRERNGDLVAVVMRCPEDALGELRHAMRRYPMTTTLRASGLRNRSSVFGYVARNAVLKREGCRTCGSATADPEAHETIVRCAALFSEMLAEAHPEQSERDRWLASERILPEWRLEGTQWTSGVLNETSALPYHYDDNNAPTWNAMVVVRRDTRGGYFHVPEWNLTLPCRDGDVCFFPAYRTLHGVTPIEKKTADAYRYSAVFYTVNRMSSCLPPRDELQWAQRARTEREETLLERQRESGLLQ